MLKIKIGHSLGWLISVSLIFAGIISAVFVLNLSDIPTTLRLITSASCTSTAILGGLLLTMWHNRHDNQI